MLMGETSGKPVLSNAYEKGSMGKLHALLLNVIQD